ncbi:MAG: hypothetical protein EBU67_08925 [Actinobacteria bacterium]|nr:hypothetical protein [Actinomycetota bacterium]
MGATVVGATVVGATVVGATVVGATVVGATVVGATVVGPTVVGATVVADGSAVAAVVEGDGSDTVVVTSPGSAAFFVRGAADVSAPDEPSDEPHAATVNMVTSRKGTVRFFIEIPSFSIRWHHKPKAVRGEVEISKMTTDHRQMTTQVRKDPQGIRSGTSDSSQFTEMANDAPRPLGGSDLSYDATTLGHIIAVEN